MFDNIARRLSLLTVVLSVIGFSPAFAQDSTFKPELDTIFQAFKTKNYEVIKPLLDPQAKIGSLPQGMNDTLVPQVLTQLPAPISYTFQSEVEEGNSTRVNTVYTYPKLGNSRQSFVFDTRRKVTALDLPEFVKAEAKSTLSPPNRHLPDRMEVPFELHNNLIYVTADLNGKEERFLLDSGSPTLALYADHVARSQLQESSGVIIGVGGDFKAQFAHINAFHWQGLKWSDFDALVLPVPPTRPSDCAGFIGYQVFKDYEMTFNYGRRVISMVRTNEEGTPVETLQANTQGVQAVPFKMNQHLPVFPMQVKGKTYNMGLDTGAGSNMLYTKFAPDFKDSLVLDDAKQPLKANLGGVGNNTLTSEVAIVDKVTVGQTSYTNMPFFFGGGTLDVLNQGTVSHIDGLLGYEFLKQFVTSINFKKGTMSIYTKGL